MSLTLPSILHISVDGLASDVSIPGITQQALGLNPEVSAEATAGSPYAQTVFNRAIRPEFTFTSYCIDKILTTIGLTGLSLKTTEEGKTGLTLYMLVSDADCGRVQAGEVHSVLRLTAGCGFLSRISANAGEDATADVRFIGLSADGVTAAIARADDLAAPAQVAETRFSLGPLAVGGVTVDKLTQMSVDFGINAEAMIHDSDVIPTTMMVDQILPVIEGTTRKTLLFGAESGQIPVGGVAAANTNSALYLRKRVAAGTYVANATAEHIKLSPTGLFQWNEIANAAGNRPHESSFRITTSQASNGDVPIVVSAASAIT